MLPVPFVALVQLLVALSGNPSSAAAARPSVQAALQDAIRRFESFDDKGAAAELRALLRRSPPAAVAAKAHIYLGLIALNATDLENAKAEFEKAVRTDVLLDLPPGLSPKAQILFAEARRGLASGTFGAPPGGLKVSPQAQQTEPGAFASTTSEQASPSRLPAYLVGGSGVLVLAAGGLFAFLQQQVKSSVISDTTGADALRDGQPYAQDGIAADVLFGVGGAALVTAIILYATEGSARAPEVAISAGPRGFALSGAF